MSKRWDTVLIAPALPLREAMAVLDRGGLRIALVVSAERRLLGTLTDGDLRRALLRHVPMDAPVGTVMAGQPMTVRPDTPREAILALMERHALLHVPVVTDDGQVVGLETLHGMMNRRRRDNPVFLMAGGFGKRLQPLTDQCPKPLLPVGEKPVLELIIDGFVQAGYHRFFISTHYRSDMIRERIGDGRRWGVDIRYVHEDEPLGTGGALGLLDAASVDRPMFLMNGDLLTTLDLNSLLDFHEEQAGVATMCVREYEHRVPYGVVQTDGLRIASMVEKPAYRCFVNAGIYVLSPELVHGVQRGRRVDMPTLLDEQLAAGRRVSMFPVHEYWLDIGRLEDFQRAQQDVAEYFHA
jgi:dTDP-glucose pyrophosphorylase